MSDINNNLGEDNKKKIELYLKLTPIIVILFICLGYFHLSSYYSLFGIDILNYIGNTELLLSFLPLFKSFVIPVIVITYLMYVLTNAKSKKDQKTDLPKTKIKRILRFFKVHILTVFVLLILCVLFMILNEMGRVYVGKSWAGFIILTSVSLGAFLSYGKMELDEKKSLVFIVCTLVLFMAPYVYNMSNYMGIVEKERYKEVTFDYLGESISTNDTLFYVGQTQSVLFIHDKKNRRNLVFELSEIDHFSSKLILPDFLWENMFCSGG